MRRIFISYSSTDKPIARRVMRRFRQAGAEVFLDEVGLRPGSGLTDALKREIEAASHVVVIWTAAAAASRWVRMEIECACAPDGKSSLLPLLFAKPSGPVSDFVGIDFSVPHRFERSFAQLLCAVFGNEAWTTASRAHISSDLEDTLREIPVLAPIFRNPLAEAVEHLAGAQPEEVLETARAAFDEWDVSAISAKDLPGPTDPSFYALDFAISCAAEIAVSPHPELGSLLAPELVKYPQLFAAIVGANTAGYEGLMTLLNHLPEKASDALSEVVDAERVSDCALNTTLELFSEVFSLIERHAQLDSNAKDQFMPFGAADGFLRNNLSRLSDTQKRLFLRLAEIRGEGPYPGGPADIVWQLLSDSTLHSEGMSKLQRWIEAGRFDGFDPKTRSETPRLLFTIALDMAETPTVRSDLDVLVKGVAARIRKFLRSAQDRKVCVALRWIAASCVLPRSERLAIAEGCCEGVISAEFEMWSRAAEVRPVALSIAAILQEPGPVLHHQEEAIRLAVEQKLQSCLG